MNKKIIAILACLFLVCGGVFAATTGGCFCLNFFLPLVGVGGVGSFVQGDYVSGGIIMGTNFAGIGMQIGGWANLIKTIGGSANLESFFNGNIGTTMKGVGGSIALILCGQAICLGSWIAGLARPWLFEKESAAKGISIYENPVTGQVTTLALNPIINTVDKEYGFSTVIRY